MFDYFARLIVAAAGFVALTLGFHLAPSVPIAPAHAAAKRASLDSLDLAEGLQATLVAQAPTITNPTNIDVDARGRVWLLEGYNYRKFKQHPLRPEGDRVVILQDTTGDGVADVTKVFYQGTDIDAAMGIAVFGNKVYVSAYTKIFVFTDTNGDDKPDKKEVLFTAGGPPDHDHSTHAFVFGPDGRLYFNGGNETRSIMDSAGNVIVDRAGNRVEQKRAPYQEGMAFRLEPEMLISYYRKAERGQPMQQFGGPNRLAAHPLRGFLVADPQKPGNCGRTFVGSRGARHKRGRGHNFFPGRENKRNCQNQQAVFVLNELRLVAGQSS